MAGFKKPSLRSAVTYFFLFALCAKVVYFFASNHPPKADLTRIQGVVQKVRMGGNGSATYLIVASSFGVSRYSSYYGTVWPGMESIQVRDPVDLLAEKNILNPHELATGKQFYMWELIHRGRTIIRYEDVHLMVSAKEATINTYINVWMGIGLLLLTVVYGHHVFKKSARD